jgi:3-methyl-2-oxobutanoate hydroxymethyltransferase
VGGPWLDGRVRSLFAAIGYLASALDHEADRYANVAETTLAALKALCDDVRAGRQIRGAAPAARRS